VQFEGSIEESQRPILDDAFVDHLQGDGYSIERVEEDPACAAADCYQQFAQDRGVTHLVRINLRGDSRDYEIKVELLDGRSGDVVATTDGFCDTCGAAELQDLVIDKAVRLQATLRAQQVGPATLVVESNPAGAAVYLDGQLVGETPLHYETVSGTRRIRVQQNGFVTAEREVELVGGVEKRVELELAPVPAIDDGGANDPSQSRVPTILKATGGAGVGVGVALIGAGIALLVLNDRPIESRCTGENVDADNDCKYLHDTMAGGIGLTVGGAVVAGVGVGLLVWGMKRGKAQPSATARLGVTRNGLMLSGRF
jgi:hypothetical protein